MIYLGSVFVSGSLSSLCCTYSLDIWCPPSVCLLCVLWSVWWHIEPKPHPFIPIPIRIKHPLTYAFLITCMCDVGDDMMSPWAQFECESSKCCLALLIAAFLFSCQSHRNRICWWAFEWRRLTSTVNLLRAQMLQLSMMHGHERVIMKWASMHSHLPFCVSKIASQGWGHRWQKCELTCRCFHRCCKIPSGCTPGSIPPPMSRCAEWEA